MPTGQARLVIPEQLRRARDGVALSIEEVAVSLGIDADQVAQWEAGAEEPSVDSLWRLGDLYRREVDYFVVPHQAIPDDLSFRHKERHRLGELSLATRQAIAWFDELCRSAREVERLLELAVPLQLPVRSSALTGDDMALDERDRLKIGDRPIKDVRKVIEDQGILVFHLPIPSEEFSGLSWDHPEHGLCVLINGAENPGRRAFTTAHEYAHLLRRDGDSVCDLQVDASAELQANRFATSFLMPATDVRDTFERRYPGDRSVGTDEIGSTARRYSVSIEAMCYRLEELNLVPAGTARSLEVTPSRYFGRSRPQWRRRLGETFTKRAIEAYSSGRISGGKLARYLGIDLRRALDFAKREVDAQPNE